MSPLTEPTRLRLHQPDFPAGPVNGQIFTDPVTNVQWFYQSSRGTWGFNDPFRSSTSLLLNGNGANGSTTIVDSSPSPKTVTTVGNAQISTAIADPFGNNTKGVIAFDGTGDSLVAPASISHFGTGDFTIELWIYRNTATTHGIQEARTGGTAAPWVWYIINGKLSFFAGADNLSTNNIPSLQWVHIAVTRSAGVLRQFINGNKESENTITANFTTGAADTQLMRLRDANTDRLNGYIDEYRVTAGIARYTANFTPPTAPFPDF